MKHSTKHPRPANVQRRQQNRISTAREPDVLAWHAAGLSLRAIVAKLVELGEPQVDPKTVSKCIRDNESQRRHAIETHRTHLEQRVLDTIGPQVVSDIQMRTEVARRLEAYELEAAAIAREPIDVILVQTDPETLQRTPRAPREVDQQFRMRFLRLKAYEVAARIARVGSGVVLDNLRAAGLIRDNTDDTLEPARIILPARESDDA